LERSSRKIIARLKKEGWVLLRIEGSHHQFMHEGDSKILTVPHAKKDLPPGLVHAIRKSAGWKG
jgi:predicted RNA binding protein YcfA (HicA-like mRNA interferase family)